MHYIYGSTYTPIPQIASWLMMHIVGNEFSPGLANGGRLFFFTYLAPILAKMDREKTVVPVILGIQTLVKWIMGASLEGFTTVILAILLSAGLIMISLGIMGFYIARIYEEIKGRPRYIISEIRQTEREA